MKAVVYKGPFRVAVEDVPDPRIEKGQSMGTGQCRVKRYNEHLRDLIIAGRATPSLLVSHAVSLSEAPDAYDKFDKRADGYTKVLLHPAAT